MRKLLSALASTLFVAVTFLAVACGGRAELATCQEDFECGLPTKGYAFRCECSVCSEVYLGSTSKQCELDRDCISLASLDPAYAGLNRCGSGGVCIAGPQQ
ncbi:MAG: hypothetical protein KBF88_01525 [Polyangiaceae bacterium]|nr:hypothetical protein [Polyangiaceae bacterium]